MADKRESGQCGLAPGRSGPGREDKRRIIKMMHLYSKELQINERNTHYIR